ncbi:MAG: DUF3881 family protein [Candidatus Ornithomonoglobus sp.]
MRSRPCFRLQKIGIQYVIGRQHPQQRAVGTSALGHEQELELPVAAVGAVKLLSGIPQAHVRHGDMAMKGDIKAIDDLTIRDYDTISDICQRVRKEDVYSIVDTSFIPSGLECDNFFVVGNIEEVYELTNEITGENIYYMLLECNDYMINLGINSKDLYGMPQAGCRFVGKIWIQGSIYFDN